MATTKISVQQLSDELFKLVGRNYLFVSKDVVTFNATSIDLSKANFTNAEGLEPEWKEVNRAAFAFVIDTSNNVIVAIANITAVDSTNNVISIIVKARENSLVYKGEVADRAHLPTTGMATGDTYYIQDEASTTYYNGTNWIDMSGDKSSFIWKCSTDLASSATTQVTVPLANLTRADDNTVVPISRDMIIGKTIIYSNDGYIGTVIALAGTTGVIVTRITKDTKSDGIYNTSDVISNDVGDTTELDVNNITNIDLDKVVLNETLIYDDAGTLAKVTAIDTTNDTVTVTTITKVSVEPSDGTYKTTDTISTTIDATTVLDVTNIAGLVLAKVVINETLVNDVNGTVAKVTAINTDDNEITVRTITTAGEKSDGTYATTETLNTQIGGTTTVSTSDIDNSLDLDEVVLNETQLYDESGTVAIITAIDTTNNEVTVTTITSTGEKSDGTYKTTDTISDAIDDTTTLDITNIAGLDLDEVVLNETLIYDANGTVGTVTAIDTTNDIVTVKTITISGGGSDGNYPTTDTISKTISDTTVLDVTNITGIDLDKVVLNETQIYDNDGTVGTVTAIDTVNDTVTVTTITSTGDKSDGTYKTTETLSIVLDDTTTLGVADITGIDLAKVVLNETRVYDANGTEGIVTAIDTENEEVTIKTVTNPGLEHVEISYTDYMALTEEEKNNGKVYHVYDAPPSAEGKIFYDTEERMTNKIWLDGKPIYRRVFVHNTVITASDITIQEDLLSDVSNINFISIESALYKYADAAREQLYQTFTNSGGITSESTQLYVYRSGAGTLRVRYKVPDAASDLTFCPYLTSITVVEYTKVTD